jgi:membrane protein YdbS with pleckstrin-like domain
MLSEETVMEQHITTFKVSLIASVIGTLAWYFGVSEMVWPAHPHVATLLITVLAFYVINYYWKTASHRAAESGTR